MNNKQRGYLVLGWVLLLGIVAGWIGNDYYHATPVQDMQDKYDGYRLCMQTAGTTHCYMTPADFTEYFQLQRKLGEEE